MKILLVDDSKSARYALRLQLQSQGIRVETTDAAESALERVRKAPPDAIFMDKTMPGMNGFEALDILKSTPGTEHIPVVMCASNEDPHFAGKAKRKGAFDVLAKPTTPDKLTALLRRLQVEAASAREAAAHTDTSLASSADVAVPAGPDPSTTLTDAQLDARIRALLEPLLDDLAKHLSQDLLAEIDGRIASHLDAEVRQLRADLFNAGTAEAAVEGSGSTSITRPSLMRRLFSRRRRGG